MENESKGLGRGDNRSRDLYILQALNRIEQAVSSGGGAQTRTHNTIISSTTGTVPAGTIRGSIMNIGSANGVWNGITLPAGVSVPWGEVAIRDTYNAINFDATGTTFLIEYTT